MIRKTPDLIRTLPGGSLITFLLLALWRSAVPAGAIQPPRQDTALLSVRDDLGRMVSIPQKVERIVSLQPEATRILAALGCADKLVGVDYFLNKNDALFGFLVPSSRKIPVVAYEDSSVNMERVIRLKPDVILASPTDSRVPDSLQEKTGRPVVAVSSLGRFDKLFDEIRLIGLVVGRSARAEELIAFFQGTIDDLSRRLIGVPRAQRPRVYLAFWSSLDRTPVAYDPVNVAGGQNVAEGPDLAVLGSNAPAISLERILGWDPDIILIHGNYRPGERRVTVEDVLADSRLRSVKAVREKRVHYTYGFWYWWDPAEVLVETLYLAKLFHPAIFRNIDLVREGNAVFKKVYGIENGYALLCRTVKCDEW